MSADLVIERWRVLLADLVGLGDALCDAIEQDDVALAVSAMCQLRRTRSELSRVERTRQAAPAPAAVAEVAALVMRAQLVEAAMHRWLARELPDDHVLLASPLGVAVIADAMLPPVWDFDCDLVVLVGAAYAPVAEILEALGQRRVIVVEDRPTAIAETTSSISVTSVAELAAAVRTLVPNPPAQFVLRAFGVDRELAERAAETVREAVADARVHRNTVCAFSRTWIEQGMANLEALARWPSVAALDGAFAGRPMVIVAPGPSLARNVDQLRGLAGRAIITAFSHSLGPVLAAGVVPDLVVTVDPQDVRYHFAGADLSRTCLVNAATVHPSLFALPAARYLTLSANSAIDDWIFDGLGEDALVPGGGSVATSAFTLALRWRCDPIVFVGLDLSFPGGAYYVSTSSDGSARASIDPETGTMQVEGWSAGFRAMKAAGGPDAARERVIELPGWSGRDGDTVPSSFMFALFHRWFVERMRSVDVRVFNCTEGGAFVEGMRHVPLAEVVPQLNEVFDPQTTLARVTVDRAARAAGLAAHLGGFLTGLRRCRPLVARARGLIERGVTGAPLERVERVLARALRPLEFASLLAQREVERAHDVARRAGDTSRYLEATSGLLATLAAVIDHLEPALAGALARLTPEHSHAA